MREANEHKIQVVLASTYLKTRAGLSLAPPPKGASLLSILGKPTAASRACFSLSSK